LQAGWWCTQPVTETYGRYQLLHRLAVGGMAEIFLARSSSLDGFEKDLIIKRIRPEHCQDRMFSSLFVDEARISISLSHHNIVHVFDFGSEDETYYLAMEYVHGCDLTMLLEATGGELEPGLALLVMQEVCRGLDHAHHRHGRHGEPLHIVHRDISPHNILISLDGGVKITDFGIAKAAGQLSQTQPGVVLGKLSFMSPEQAGGKVVDQRADVFSAGVVLWEALVGSRIHEGFTGLDLIERIHEASFDLPSKANPKLSTAFDDLLTKALAHDPNDRFASARDFGTAIHATMADTGCRASSYDLMSFMETHWQALAVTDFEELDSQEPTRALEELPPPQEAPDATQIDAVPTPQRAVCARPEFTQAVEAFRATPSLWQMVDMADICAAAGDVDEAVAIWRVVAVKFALRGMLAQTLLCCHRMLQHRPLDSLRADLEAMPGLATAPPAKVETHLYRGNGAAETLVRSLLASAPSHGLSGRGTPLLENLSGHAFAEMAAHAPLRVLEPGEAVVRQDDVGRSMYLVGRGRVVIYADDAQGTRIYLSSLIAGDFFGENGFFSGAPRSATVEAHGPVEVFEIEPALYDRVMGETFAATAALLQFYKERIADTLLARSPVFGLLTKNERRPVVAKLEFAVFEPGALVIQEGERSDDIFLIKSGEAEVHTNHQGQHTTLATLAPATVFGEVAALQGIPRTASVTAKSKLETLKLTGADFLALLDASPDLHKRVFHVVSKRARENIERLGEE